MVLTTLTRTITMRFPVILLAGVVFGGILPVHAAGYHPEQKVIFKGKQKALQRDAIQSFNSLPELGRQALIASRLDLFFSDSGISRYNSYFRWPDPGGKFVGADGNVRGWHQVRDGIPPVQWNEADRKLWDVGHNAVFPAVAKEVTAVIYATAKEIVNSMPPELRDSWLAEEAGLLYSTTGGKAYGRGYDTTTTDSGREVKHRKLNGLYDLRFVDAEGKEQAFGTVLSTHAKIWERRRKILYLCIQYTSRKEILELFSKEIATLAKNKDSFTPQNGASTPAAKETPPKPAAERTTMGDTTPPSAAPQPAPASNATPAAPAAAQPTPASAAKGIPTSAPPIAPPSDRDLPTVAILKKIPAQAREAWIAEHLGMCFMEDNSKSMDQKNWVRGGAKYIGSDGQPHDFWSSQRKASNRWDEMNKGAKVQGELIKVLSAFPELIEQMVMHTAKTHLSTLPELMRDAWLCEASGFFYLPDGSKGPYNTNTTNEIRTDSGFITRYHPVGRGCWRDTTGKEHRMAERNGYWSTCSKRWDTLQLCAELIGADKVVEALPEVMAELRKHNKVSDSYKPLPPILYTCDTTEAEAYFRTMPKPQQDAWLSETLGICFLPNPSDSPFDAGNNPKKDTLFIDRTGKECRYYDCRYGRNQDWSAWRNLITRLPKGRLSLVSKLPEEAEALALGTIKHHLLNMPPLMRDAWLCIGGGLCFMPNSNEDPFQDNVGTFTTNNGNAYLTKSVKGNAVFVDTKGERHQMSDRGPYWQSVGRRWSTSVACLKYCDISKVLEAFSAEMAILRKNYETATGKKAPGAAPGPAAEKSSSSSSSSGSRKTGMGTQWF